MQPFFADYLERMQAIFQDFDEVISGLSPAGLNWEPGPDMNALAVLVIHTAGATRYWVGDVALEEPSNRLRASEFEPQDRDEAALRQHLSTTEAYIRDGLERLTLADLETVRHVNLPNGMTECTISWALLHALEHASQHLGHAQLARQLWDTHKA